MTPEQSKLWNKIQAFPLDVEEAEFSFSNRLARENGWTRQYTLKVIDEYKKFIYLCCISDQGVTPSDPVDQVWHLHLTYTKSYWIDFCKNTLERDIHHNPTKGGKKEGQKFEKYYSHLKDIYQQHFQLSLPTDIWHSKEVRFTDIDFQRINLKNYWLIKKPKKQILSALTILIIAILGITSIQASGNNVQIVIIVAVIFVIGVFAFISSGKNPNGNSSSGCTIAGGCSSEDSHGSTNSGGTGCSGSGCSGCGGGGGE